MQLNVAEKLLDHSRTIAQSTAIRFRADDEREDVTYAELAARVRATAGAIRAQGVEPEQRVLLILPDRPELVASFLGAIWGGAIALVANCFLRADDYEAFIEDAGAKLVITTSVLAAELEPRFASRARAPKFLSVGANGQGTFAAAVAASTPLTDAHPSHAEDAAFWLYSSGTTGKPKGTIHLHGDIPFAVETYGKSVLGTTSADVVYATSKAFFAYGLGASVYFPLAAGATVVLAPEPFRPDRVWKIIAAEQPTIFFSVPSCYRALLDNAPADPKAVTASMRRCPSAGESLPPTVYEDWLAKTGHQILDGIGSTEMLHIYLSNFPGEAAGGTLDRVVPGYEIRLVDERGLDVPDGEPGAMLARGGSLAAGYWRRLEATRSAFHGDWYVTGDQAMRDSDGRYRILGRTDDLFKVSGQWVSPSDVEDVVARTTGVRECAVVCSSPGDGLTKVVAFVVADASASDDLTQRILDGCASSLARFKRPQEVKRIDALPRTATGKVQRFRLRALLEGS